MTRTEAAAERDRLQVVLISPLTAVALLPVGVWLFVLTLASFVVPMVIASIYSIAYARSHRLDGAQG